MKSLSIGALTVAGIALAAMAGIAGAAHAQSGDRAEPKVKTTPFNYVLKNGKRAPKPHRVTNPDGSWREESRVGNCVTIKEGSPNGEVKIYRNPPTC